MKQFSLAEELNQKIRQSEQQANDSSNIHEVDHRFFRNFLKLPAASLRQLTVSLMLGSVDGLSATLRMKNEYKIDPGSNRRVPQHITLLKNQIQGLLFEYGAGVLVFDQRGRVHKCIRKRYIPGDEVILAIYDRCKACNPMILNLLDELINASGRANFLGKLRKISANKMARREPRGEESRDQQLELPLSINEHRSNIFNDLLPMN